MSVVRFRAQNHPHQTKKRGPKTNIDDRATSPELFDALNARFRFTVDVAAATHNAKCPRYFSIADDGLLQSWAAERVWCNPPYSDIRPWVEKAWMEADHAELIVMLLPANRTEQAWWQELVEPYRDRRIGLTVEFLAERQRFVRPGSVVDMFGRPRGAVERPPFGVCLLVWSS